MIDFVLAVEPNSQIPRDRYQPTREYADKTNQI